MVAPGGHAWLLNMRGCSWRVGGCVVAPGGVHVWLLPGGGGGHAWLLLGEGHVWLLSGEYVWLLGGGAWDTTRYGDTINERAVRILLECILICW